MSTVKIQHLYLCNQLEVVAILLFSLHNMTANLLTVVATLNWLSNFNRPWQVRSRIFSDKNKI